MKTEITTHLTRRQIEGAHADLFHKVVTTYAQVAALPILKASCMDPDARPSRTLSPAMINFAVDVEHATERALRGSPDLQKDWFTLAAGEPLLAEKKKAVIAKCAPFYAARNLDPKQYFANKRPDSVKRRPA